MRFSCKSVIRRVWLRQRHAGCPTGVLETGMTYLGPFIMAGLLAGTFLAIWLDLWAIGGAGLGGIMGAVLALALEKVQKAKKP